MDSDDILGDDGRKALLACVRIGIYGRKSAPERQKICYGEDAGLLEHKFEQRFTISDTNNAFETTSSTGRLLRYSEDEGPGTDEVKVLNDKNRPENISKDYQEAKEKSFSRREYSRSGATTMTEIDHGSGFIIHDCTIITNKHVIQTYLDDQESYRICISNKCINELPCIVVDVDCKNDLAFLYCSKLEDSGICPLKLSEEPLLTGMSVICFGYPIHHTGKTALCVDGKVSGFKDILYRDSLVVLNCSLNAGNSGGPVLRRIQGQLKVVGVVKDKHIKEIFDEDEIDEMLRDSMENKTICDVQGATKTPMTNMSINTRKLVYKLNYALTGTHSPFNFSTAIPGHLVTKFVENICERQKTQTQK